MSKGHTIPLLHLAHLLLRRRIFVTVFTTPANHPFIANFLSETNADILDLHFPENVSGIPACIESTDKLPSISLFHQFALATALMQPDFEKELEKLPAVNFLVSDSFLWWTAESAAKFGIPRLVFSGMSNYATCLSKCVVENRLLLGLESDDDLITLPDFPWIKITRNDFESQFRDLEQQKETPFSDFMFNIFMSYSISYGFISNSFYELEPLFADHLNQLQPTKTFCTGPFCLAIKTPNFAENQKPSWIKWLDEKLIQGKPVLYVAFGSQAEISDDQLKEIAIGLEESMVNFLWVTRKISDLEESVKGRGIIVKEWVDQMEILMHKSVEGFLSHCGWNSTIESICAGVPILAWPMMAEQPLNARMVVEEIKVGLRVETCNNGFVKSEGLKKMVKQLMEEEIGKEVKDNVKKYSEMAIKAIEEGTGSSSKTLDSLILEICGGKNGAIN
ncbi:UDP-glycosyltransferase 90A1-like [Euphorbia lathyris]|uniref:UDP-glycosyltransferase 90A1-like n=1 Tax=Euphorbia lathyris TaxID=212925 RepID=UPI0033130D17